MLDTNILIYIIKNKPISVFENFNKYKPNEIAISSIVYGEMIYGIYNSQYIDKNLKAFHALVDNIEILHFDTVAAEYYGKIKSKLKTSGTLISDNDLLIGAHALSLKLPLVSNNIREYELIDNLRLENWV
jgi:tRNA(fMet)-specific endonuclease VapC